MPLEDLQSSLTFSFHHCVTKDLERTQQHTKPEKLQPDTAAESALFIIILHWSLGMFRRPQPGMDDVGWPAKRVLPRVLTAIRL